MSKSHGLKMAAGAILLMPVGIIILIVGCSKPNVKHSMVAPEAREIQVWLINLGIESQAADSSAAVRQFKKEFASELANEDYYLAYLEEVGRELSSLGHNVADGPVGEGTIRIKPSASKRSDIIIGPGTDLRLIEWNRLERQDTPSADDRSPWGDRDRSGTEYVKPVYHKTDEVRNVYIEMLGPEGKLLGAIDITGGKVKAEFVAKVIDRLIKEGEW